MAEPEVSTSRRGVTVGRVLRSAGLLVVLAALGWAAYLYIGTNVAALHRYGTTAADLRRQWTSPATSEGVPGGAIGLLRVPAFGGDYEVPILPGTDRRSLTRGVGHYPGTALPGQRGNCALAGLRLTHGQPFRELLDLHRGDRVVLETSTAVYTYVLDVAPRDLTVQPGDGWVLQPVPGQRGRKPSSALLTMTTNQDLVATPDRSIGIGHLASTTNKR